MNSPTWHRRARKQRGRARGILNRLRDRSDLSFLQVERCRAALLLLCAHHTRPFYRISSELFGHLRRQQFPYLSSLMSGNWNTWKWNNQNRKAQGQPRKGTQQASQRGGKGFQGGIPFLRWIIGLSFVYGSCYVLYGCLTTASAWYLAEAASKDKDVADELTALMNPEASEQEQIKMQQRRLNAMRKLQTRSTKRRN